MVHFYHFKKLYEMEYIMRKKTYPKKSNVVNAPIIASLKKLSFPHYIFYNFNELRFRSSGTINTRNDFHTIAKLCYSFHVVNTVNGVICLSRNRSSHTSYTDLVILWNPFIRRHIQLPLF